VRSVVRAAACHRHQRLRLVGLQVGGEGAVGVLVGGELAATTCGACSASARISEFNRLSFDDHAAHLELRIEHDDVGPGAGASRPRSATPRCSAASVAVRREASASDRPRPTRLRSAWSIVNVLPASVPSASRHAAQAFGDGVAAEPVAAVGHAGGGGGVGDAIQPRDGAQGDADRPGVHVQQVGNDLRALRQRQRRAAMPGSRWCRPVMALNRWVKPVAPAASAASPSS